MHGEESKTPVCNRQDAISPEKEETTTKTDRRGVEIEGKSIRFDTTCASIIVDNSSQCQGTMSKSCRNVREAAYEKRRSRCASCRRHATAECSVNMYAYSTSQEILKQTVSQAHSLLLGPCRSREASGCIYGNFSATYSLATPHAPRSSVRCRLHGRAPRTGDS